MTEAVDWYMQYEGAHFGKLPEWERGRNLRGGYSRGCGIEFSKIVKTLYERDPLWVEAIKIAKVKHDEIHFKAITSEAKLANIYLILTRFLKECPGGHIVEFGSFRGGSAAFMGYIVERVAPGTKVYALDTFRGMPPTNPGLDHHQEGDFSENSPEAVRAFIDSTGVKNVELVPGLFADTAPKLMPTIGKASFTHIDCDIYAACVDAYEAVKPWMVPKGFYVLDDPTFGSCVSAMMFVEDFMVVRDGLRAEQVYPHMVYRHPG